MKTFASTLPILPKKPEERQFWGQLHGAASSLGIFTAASAHDGLIVVITPDSSSTLKLERELNFFVGQDSALPILNFPDWEILPYDHFSPHQDIISDRLLALHRLPQLKKGILIIAINTLMHYVAPSYHVDAQTFALKKNDEIDSVEFQRRLERSGYRHVSQVMEHGEFSVRGALLDVFPMGSKQPYRIDLFDNIIDSIRIFEPDTQRSAAVVEAIELLPAKEFPLTETAITQFRQAWRSKFQGNPALCPIYDSITKGQYAAGIEYYLPLFFEQLQTVFDYLPTNSLLVQVEDVAIKAQQFWDEVKHRYEQLSHDIQRPILEPKDIVLTTDSVFGQMKKWPQLLITENPCAIRAGCTNFKTQPPSLLPINHKLAEPLHAVKEYLLSTNDRVLFIAETLGRREAILNLLNDIQVTPTLVASWQEFVTSNDKINIALASLDIGMVLEDPAISIITESQLFGQQVMQRRLRTRAIQNPENIIRDLAELKIGSPVVHISHGVGRYVGLQTLKTDHYEAEYLTLEYSGGDKLYVPISSLHMIARYTGQDDDHAPLYQLGSKKWERIKQKAAEKIRDVAAELLDIYSKRASKQGHAFSEPNQYYTTFSAEFPFEETPDQLKAIDEVIQDMVLPRAMDRLVCGDVGFGKTEVAMRAAFIATQDNAQVGFLVPTTLLAQQHYQNLLDRFANWPIKIAALSRFQSPKEQKQIIQDIADGKIDIVIGTHKLLQPDVKFKNLGLLIVDEEHRFGVTQKDRIKAIKNNVDILILTATPIPRTLNMSLTGVRDLSIIATPPSKRLSIKTFVHEYNPSLIREAVLREILRGGQVYFLHNDVRTINETTERLSTLIPEAKINYAHGQMTERSLEKVMSDFYHNRFNVLVTSTIVESGIDIPTANTIIINKANHFGLAQLHQLRGRVGRSHHQAYAYLLTPPVNTLTKDALKRLEAITSLEDLGSGFILATHDLEIRGAGEILGEDQSGFIEDIGFNMYSEMLDRAVQALKDGKEIPEDLSSNSGCEIDIKITALIPEHYIPDVHIRLTFYKQIASAKTQSHLHELQVEMIDRFGLLPEQLKNLFTITELKLKADPLGIPKIEIGSSQARIEFVAEPKINLNTLLNLIQKQSKDYQLEGAKYLKITFGNSKTVDNINLVLKTLDLIKL